MVPISDHSAEVTSPPEAPAAPRLMTDEETAEQPSDKDLVLEDLLVEDVSIDGMCGVY